MGVAMFGVDYEGFSCVASQGVFFEYENRIIIVCMSWTFYSGIAILTIFPERIPRVHKATIIVSLNSVCRSNLPKVNRLSP